MDLVLRVDVTVLSIHRIDCGDKVFGGQLAYGVVSTGNLNQFVGGLKKLYRGLLGQAASLIAIPDFAWIQSPKVTRLG